MRILITSFTYAPHANGVAEVVGVHAADFVRRGHDVTVATAFAPDRMDSTSAPAAQPRVVQFKIRSGRDPGLAEAEGNEIQRYQRFLREERFDVIFCHCWQVWSTDMALEALPGSGAKKIMISHGFSAHLWVPHGTPPWGLGQWWRARKYVRRLPRMMRLFDHVVFLSPIANRDRFYDHWTLERSGGPPWSAIPNGTWPDKLLHGSLDFRKTHGLGDSFLALYVALYVPGKNQEAALRAFMAANLENSTLVFIGNEHNGYSRKLEQLYRDLSRGRSNPRVLFLEKQDKNAIAAAYRAMDVFLMTSKAESLPLVLLDAMACSKPFVSTPVGCVADLPGGLVVKDESATAACLAQLHRDPARRAELGREGFEAVRKTYRWEAVLDAYERLIQTVTAQG